MRSFDFKKNWGVCRLSRNNTTTSLRARSVRSKRRCYNFLVNNGLRSPLGMMLSTLLESHSFILPFFSFVTPPFIFIAVHFPGACLLSVPKFHSFPHPILDRESTCGGGQCPPATGMQRTAPQKKGGMGSERWVSRSSLLPTSNVAERKEREEGWNYLFRVFFPSSSSSSVHTNGLLALFLSIPPFPPPFGHCNLGVLNRDWFWGFFAAGGWQSGYYNVQPRNMFVLDFQRVRCANVPAFRT